VAHLTYIPEIYADEMLLVVLTRLVSVRVLTRRASIEAWVPSGFSNSQFVETCVQVAESEAAAGEMLHLRGQHPPRRRPGLRRGQEGQATCFSFVPHPEIRGWFAS